MFVYRIKGLFINAVRSSYNVLNYRADKTFCKIDGQNDQKNIHNNNLKLLP
jgi:hypothetical protein